MADGDFQQGVLTPERADREKEKMVSLLPSNRQDTPDGLLLKEVAPGISSEEAQSVTEPRLIISEDIKEMEF